MGLVRVLDLLNMQSFFLQNSIGQAMAKNKTKTFDYGEIKTKKAPFTTQQMKSQHVSMKSKGK